MGGYNPRTVPLYCKCVLKYVLEFTKSCEIIDSIRRVAPLNLWLDIVDCAMQYNLKGVVYTKNCVMCTSQ